MNRFLTEKLKTIYPVCFSFPDEAIQERLQAACAMVRDPDALPEALEQQAGGAAQDFLADLARLELTLSDVAGADSDFSRDPDRIEINPTLRLLKLSWKNLVVFLDRKNGAPSARPEPAEEMVLVWRHPRTKEPRVRVATDEDLLVLKMAVEDLDPTEVAAAGGLPVGALDRSIEHAVRKGILLKPRSRIRRDPAVLGIRQQFDERFIETSFFTLQWHITQACDLHCKHCYDRSERSYLGLDQALAVLDDLRSFCSDRHVSGQVSFSGGNPLLYPHFTEVYRAAADRGFITAILGNPAPRERIEELIEIRMPAFYQVSLEGLPAHNDTIRGTGHFERVVTFLGMLKGLGVSTMVMLTLTRDNIDHVIRLAEMLRGVVDDFHFNRLSMVGEGAGLLLPTPEKYRAFLDEYLAANNPILGLKDNLINIIHQERRIPLFGGCTGFGCGAAFNFISLLSNGEALACRKFPSPIGNVLEKGIAGVYDSEAAQRYRKGCRACKSCEIRPVCGGCLASAYSHGLNIFEERDPFCFMKTGHSDHRTS